MIKQCCLDTAIVSRTPLFVQNIQFNQTRYAYVINNNQMYSCARLLGRPPTTAAAKAPYFFIRRMTNNNAVRWGAGVNGTRAAPAASAAGTAAAAAGDGGGDASAAAASAAAAEAQKRGGGNSSKKPKKPNQGVSFATDMKESPFNELKLPIVMEGAGKVRVRQHVNPLRAEYQQPAAPVDWAGAFKDPTRPLVVDLGCGPGRFLLLLARRAAAGGGGAALPQADGCNFLGIEIRRPLVDRANEWARQLGAEANVHYIFANATVSLRQLLSTYPGPVEAFFVQFPDPHFKRRHRKRRLLQPDTVAALRDVLRSGGRVFLQSDVMRAAEDMRDAIEEAAGNNFELAPLHDDASLVFHASSRSSGSGGGGSGENGIDAQAAAGSDLVDPTAEWQPSETGSDDADEEATVFVSTWAEKGWLRDNPLGVPTEREYYVASTQGAPIYRVLLVRR